MQRDTSPHATLGYGTNVHPGSTLAELKYQLDRHAVGVRERICPDQSLGISLWFSDDVVRELLGDRKRNQRYSDLKTRQLRDWLQQRGLDVFTLNGFPQHNFHQPVVKHDVYQPSWAHAERRDHTLDLVHLLDLLLPDGAAGSISTLPLGWGDDIDDVCGDHLLDVVEALAQLEAQTGRYIHLNPEPEPGCVIEDTASLAAEFNWLEGVAAQRGLPGGVLRRHLRPCLDICHAAVMFEPADHLLKWCRRSGFTVGKVQISSALRVRFDAREKEDDTLQQRWEALESFAEPRYLHQTTWGNASRHRLHEFFDDLPEALADHDELTHPDEWRVHFHVPVHLETLGPLGTTQSDIVKLLQAIQPSDGIEHFEVETYAWDVLPEAHRPAELADGIAAELRWVKPLIPR